MHFSFLTWSYCSDSGDCWIVLFYISQNHTNILSLTLSYSITAPLALEHRDISTREIKVIAETLPTFTMSPVTVSPGRHSCSGDNRPGQHQRKQTWTCLCPRRLLTNAAVSASTHAPPTKNSCFTGNRPLKVHRGDSGRLQNERDGATVLKSLMCCKNTLLFRLTGALLTLFKN